MMVASTARFTGGVRFPTVDLLGAPRAAHPLTRLCPLQTWLSGVQTFGSPLRACALLAREYADASSHLSRL